MVPSIFVSIANYRDSECPATLEDLFAKADEPSRVTVGVLYQVIPGEDDDCTLLPPAVPHAQLRTHSMHANESRGVCWARNMIQTELWGGEDYYLQIDSHMRFMPGWDTRLLDMHARCGAPLAVLSTYPAPYTPPNQLGEPVVPVLVPKHFDGHGILGLLGRPLAPGDIPPEPLPNAFIAAGFLFGPGSMVEDVPYDPHIYFGGEESTLAARLWTHGYDLFSPNEHLIYHDYTTTRARPRHWTDHRDWGELSRRSVARVRHLLGRQPSDDVQALVDLDRYGFGTVRSLEEYQRYADVDFAARRIGQRGADGRFPPPMPADQERATLRRQFSLIYQSNTWRCNTSRSGPGASRGATTMLRPALAGLIRDLGVRTMVDAGCGEFGWLREVTLGFDLYLGYDIVPELAERNRQMVPDRPGHLFAEADITRAVLPRSDAILCRHCFTHLPYADIARALECFRRSGSTWLFATTHPGCEERDVEPGFWRPVDLAHVRFGLGPPQLTLRDLPGEGSAMLGVWKLGPAAAP